MTQRQWPHTHSGVRGRYDKLTIGISHDCKSGSDNCCNESARALHTAVTKRLLLDDFLRLRLGLTASDSIVGK